MLRIGMGRGPVEEEEKVNKRTAIYETSMEDLPAPATSSCGLRTTERHMTLLPPKPIRLTVP